MGSSNKQKKLLNGTKSLQLNSESTNAQVIQTQLVQRYQLCNIGTFLLPARQNRVSTGSHLIQDPKWMANIYSCWLRFQEHIEAPVAS